MTVFVVHIRNAAAHTGRKVATCFAQHRHGTAGHVFTTVVTGAFHHCGGARQTNGKTLAAHTSKESFTGGGAVHHGVAHNDVLAGHAAELEAWANHNATARQTFAGVIIGFTNEVQRDALGHKRAKGLTASAFELNANGVVWQTFWVHFGHST